jgi:hypothetical protein
LRARARRLLRHRHRGRGRSRRLPLRPRLRQRHSGRSRAAGAGAVRRRVRVRAGAAAQRLALSDHAYSKLVDTSDRLADHGLYFSYDDLGYYPHAYGDDNELLQPGTWYTVVATRSAGGEYTGYIDGVQRFRFQDVGGDTRIPASGTLTFFRDDTATQDEENSQGGVARLRLFDVALTPAEVAALGGGSLLFRNGFEG